MYNHKVMCHTFSYLWNDYENCLKVAEKLYYKEPNNFTTTNKVCHEIKQKPRVCRRGNKHTLTGDEYT